MIARTLDSSVGLLNLFGDPTRVRLMALLEQHELTVAELTRVTELSQSRVSTHLRRLREAGLLRDRRAGAATYYRAAPDPPAGAAELWQLVRAGLGDALLEADAERRDALLRARAQGEEWAARHAGRLERHYSPGRTWESAARGFLALLELGDVCDVGCGDGTVAELLAPRARSIVGLERNPKLVAAAEQRLAAHANARAEAGDMHALPFAAGAFDDVLLLHVLTHSAQPELVVREAVRVCRPGGRLLITTLAAHAHDALTAEYGHVNAGFTPEAVSRVLIAAGARVVQCGVTSRERRAPHFEVITAVARKGEA